MFRPYSLTSIAAWTVGSLAGNKAYHAAKSRNSGFKGSPTKAPQAVRKLHRNLEQIEADPPAVRDLRRKLIQIEDEAVSMHKDMSKVFNGSRGKKNLTSLIKWLAYTAWFHQAKEQLKIDIRDVYEATRQQGYVWPSNVIAEVQNVVDGMATRMQDVSDNILRQILPQIPNAETALDEIREQQRRYNVDPSTYKIVDNRDALEAANPSPTASATDQALYLARGDQDFGPFCYKEMLGLMKVGKVRATDLIAYDGAPAWVTVEAFIANVNTISKC